MHGLNAALWHSLWSGVYVLRDMVKSPAVVTVQAVLSLNFFALRNAMR